MTLHFTGEDHNVHKLSQRIWYTPLFRIMIISGEKLQFTA